MFQEMETKCGIEQKDVKHLGCSKVQALPAAGTKHPTG
jgi:hypothetical protein